MSFFIAEAFFFHHIEPVRTEQTEKNIRARQVAEMREEMRVQELKRLEEEETRLREEHMESERLAYETEKDIQEAIRVKQEMDNLEAQEAARKELLAQALLNLKEKSTIWQLLATLTLECGIICWPCNRFSIIVLL